MTSEFREEFNRNIGDWILAHPGENPSEEQWRYLRGFAESLVTFLYPKSEVEDIVQNVCVSLSSVLQKEQIKSDPYNYFQTTCRNEALHRLKKNRKGNSDIVGLSQDEEFIADYKTEQPIDTLIHQESVEVTDSAPRLVGTTREILEKAINLLPSENQKLLFRHVMLGDIHQSSTEEMTSAIGINVNAVKKASFNGKGKLDTILSQPQNHPQLLSYATDDLETCRAVAQAILSITFKKGHPRTS